MLVERILCWVPNTSTDPPVCGISTLQSVRTSCAYHTPGNSGVWNFFSREGSKKISKSYCDWSGLESRLLGTYILDDSLPDLEPASRHRHCSTSPCITNLIPNFSPCEIGSISCPGSLLNISLTSLGDSCLRLKKTSLHSVSVSAHLGIFNTFISSLLPQLFSRK